MCAIRPRKASRDPQTFGVAKKFALCKLRGMGTPTELAAAAGISVPYASQIMSGERIPPVATAISIYRKTGLKFGPIADANEEDIEAAARIHGLAA